LYVFTRARPPVQADVDGTPQYPRELMRWSADFYRPVFERLLPRSGSSSSAADAAAAVGPFGLQEHDYCLGDRKFGGNAQTISRDRWVHHTSFLWQFHAARMGLLTLPEKRPDYRRDRPHTDFLTALGDVVPPGTPHGAFHDCVAEQLRATFDVAEVDPAEALAVADASTERRSNVFVQY
jgi:lipoate-protein ligase A